MFHFDHNFALKRPIIQFESHCKKFIPIKINTGAEGWALHCFCQNACEWVILSLWVLLCFVNVKKPCNYDWEWLHSPNMCKYLVHWEAFMAGWITSSDERVQLAFLFDDALMMLLWSFDDEMPEMFMLTVIHRWRDGGAMGTCRIFGRNCTMPIVPNNLH